LHWDGAGSGAFKGGDRTLIRSIWVFLAPGRFAAKTPAHACWISLDFLGFSRPNRDFSMSYAVFLPEEFFLALCPWRRETPEWAGVVLACGSAGLFMGRAYSGF
jgi:hypothetical protein